MYRLPETECMTSIAVSNDSNYLLVNVSKIQEIHLWDLKRKKLLHIYRSEHISFLCNTLHNNCD